MDLAQLLKQSGAIGNIAQQLGVNETVAQAGADALLPAILGGFKKSAHAQPAGVNDLGGLLGQLGGGGLLGSLLGPEPTPVDQGNNILGEIFGSKDVSRSVAGQASNQTGIEPSLLKKMLPMLAMLVAGYLANRQGGASAGPATSGGGLGDILGGLLGSNAPQPGGSGGIGSILDFDGDGNPLDDIIGMAGKMMR